MKYISEHGSTVTLSGKHGKITDISFDWLEEGCCIECSPYFNFDDEEPAIIVGCDDCGTKKIPVTLRLACPHCGYEAVREHVIKNLMSHCPRCFEFVQGFQDAIDGNPTLDGETTRQTPGRAG